MTPLFSHLPEVDRGFSTEEQPIQFTIYFRRNVVKFGLVHFKQNLVPAFEILKSKTSVQNLLSESEQHTDAYIRFSGTRKREPKKCNFF